MMLLAAFDWDKLTMTVGSAVIFAVIGLAFFALAFWVITRFMQYSFHKELEEDKNVAIAIVIASVILGIALIISAAIRG
jgi:putative membrane protein